MEVVHAGGRGLGCGRQRGIVQRSCHFVKVFDRLGLPEGVWFAGYGVVTKGDVVCVNDGVGKCLMTWGRTVTTLSCHLVREGRGKGERREEGGRTEGKGGMGEY